MRKLRAVGYWYSDPSLRLGDNARFPDPRSLIRPGWLAAEKEQILAYLRSGWTWAHWRGHSYCRFQCGISHSEMGSRCLSDGIWVWPEGLPHYVQEHDVYLPYEFIRTMRRRGWKIPPKKQPPTRRSYGEPTYAYWIEWGSKHAAKNRANSLASS
jgi:hypothetical protein